MNVRALVFSGFAVLGLAASVSFADEKRVTKDPVPTQEECSDLLQRTLVIDDGGGKGPILTELGSVERPPGTPSPTEQCAELGRQLQDCDHIHGRGGAASLWGVFMGAVCGGGGCSQVEDECSNAEALYDALECDTACDGHPC